MYSHCHGSSPGVWIYREPKEMNPETIWAVPFIKTIWHSGLTLFANRRALTPITDPQRLLIAGVKHSTDYQEACSNTTLAYTQLFGDG